jgi:hypothetical protein
VLEAEIVMQLAGPVLLHHELPGPGTGAAGSARSARWLGRDRESALAVVFGEPPVTVQIRQP